MSDVTYAFMVSLHEIHIFIYYKYIKNLYYTENSRLIDKGLTKGIFNIYTLGEVFGSWLNMFQIKQKKI